MAAPPAKLLAWNGVSFEAPADWEILSFGKNALMAGLPEKPLFSCRFNHVKGRFNLKKHFARLKKAHQGPSAQRPEPVEPPASWGGGLSRFDALCFRWGERSAPGLGAILHDPQSAVAAVVHLPEPLAPEIAARLFATFAAYPFAEPRPFALFDFFAVLPGGYALTRYKLTAGYYRLELAAKGTTLTIERFGPAELALAGRSLEAWSRELWEAMVKKYAMIPETQMRGDDMVVTWEKQNPPGVLARLAGLSPRFRIHGWARARHEAAHAKLFALSARSYRPLDIAGLLAIEKSYATVSPQEA